MGNSRRTDTHNDPCVSVRRERRAMHTSSVLSGKCWLVEGTRVPLVSLKVRVTLFSVNISDLHNDILNNKKFSHCIQYSVLFQMEMCSCNSPETFWKSRLFKKKKKSSTYRVDVATRHVVAALHSGTWESKVCSDVSIRHWFDVRKWQVKRAGSATSWESLKTSEIFHYKHNMIEDGVLLIMVRSSF